MRTPRVVGLVAAVLIGAILPVVGEDKKEASAPTIDELIADLGDPVFTVREKAQRELWKRGDAAIPALEKAARNDDPEIVRRARELLDKFSWGIRPDTPAAVLKLLKQFQAGDENPQQAIEVRKAAITDLIAYGPQGIAVVKALLKKDLAPDFHRPLVAQVVALLRREIPLRLFEGKVEEASELAALHLAGTGAEGAADFAAFHLLRGDLPAAIQRAEAAKNQRDSNSSKFLLAHLYRTNLDWSKARQLASDLPAAPGRPNSTEILLEEEGDWARLADTIQFGNTNHPDAVQLTMLRLAGRTKAFEEEIERIKRESEEFSTPEEVGNAAIALFANHRVEAAARILQDHKLQLGLLAETLIARLQFRDALEAVNDKLPAQEQLVFDLRRARLLMLTGQRTAAAELFDKVSKGLLKPNREDNNPVRSIRSLLRAEVKVGLKDLGAEHAANFLTGPMGVGDKFSGESACEILFDHDCTAGEALFWALRARRIPGNEPGATMIRVRELLTGKAGRAAVDEAIAAVQEWQDVEEMLGTENAVYYPAIPQFPLKVRKNLAVAAVCRAAGRAADAEIALKTAVESMGETGKSRIDGPRSWVYGTSDESRPWLELGDFLVDHGRYREASMRFEEGWRKFPDQPLLLFLSGQALVKAGDTKEGERRQELSHWVALGQERLRGRFLEELVRRGEGKAAKRETEIILHGCWSRDHFFGNVMNQASRASLLNRDFATTENCIQRSLLVILKTRGVYYVETSAYMTVPHEMLVCRARAKLAAGKVEEAMALAREALAVTPGNIDLVSGMVPELDRLGKNAQADELFNIAWSAYQKLLKDFPDSPYARHALASLAANCRRKLDQGQKYAEEAVLADPLSTPYREALAEVYFRQGSREMALITMKRLSEEEPRNLLFKRQLNRYRQGALDSLKPERADD